MYRVKSQLKNNNFVRNVPKLNARPVVKKYRRKIFVPELLVRSLSIYLVSSLLLLDGRLICWVNPPFRIKSHMILIFLRNEKHTKYPSLIICK